MAHGDDPIGRFQAQFFEREDVLVWFLAAPVVFQGVDVHDQGAAAHALGADAGRERHPVVHMDHVETFGQGQALGCLAVAGDFGHQVAAVVRSCGQHAGRCPPPHARLDHLKNTPVLGGGQVGGQDGVDFA